jgi:hypothetical protein
VSVLLIGLPLFASYMTLFHLSYPVELDLNEIRDQVSRSWKIGENSHQG